MMLLMGLERWDVRRDGPLSEAALRQKLNALEYDAAPRIYPAGPAAAPQAHGQERVLAVLAGLIKATIDGESAILTAGDALFVSRGAICRVEVVGSSPASCLEAVHRADPI